ncbi:MAG TPA: hypothetical protein VJV23_07355 [Candidatus Polarisedimenticolia bacterium]|nr:hypothetical protein [Candidatus Polarisedimenticolia bacterium]
MTRPRFGERASGSAGEPAEDETKRQYTSTISAVGEKGREIYVYLGENDSLECKDSPTGHDESSWIRVKVDVNGCRHWSIELAPDDALETGRLLPPPPPGGGGG